MLRVNYINLYDIAELVGFEEFFESGAAGAALFENDTIVGICALGFEGGAVRLKKIAIRPEFDNEEYRRFFLRAAVLAVIEGGGVIRADFCDALLEEMGFLRSGGGMSCRADKVKFPRMCQQKQPK